MFGCVVAGRPLQTDLTTVDATHAYFSLPHASSINHIALFLTGTVPFPAGVGASVHFFWPGKGFQLLGMLSNDKPSAVFRVRGTFSNSSGGGGGGGGGGGSGRVFGGVGGEGDMGGMNEDVTAILGLAIEPLDAIAAQLPSPNGANNATSSSTALVKTPSLGDTVALAERIVKHLFNYVSGFSGGQGDVLVPMSVIMKWYENFTNKLKTGGVGFLE
ncbi:hypothetical protein DFP72DRAFT_964694, partial [Ephemerocybe angulata]